MVNINSNTSTGSVHSDSSTSSFEENDTNIEKKSSTSGIYKEDKKENNVEKNSEKTHVEKNSEKATVDNKIKGISIVESNNRQAAIFATIIKAIVSLAVLLFTSIGLSVAFKATFAVVVLAIIPVSSILAVALFGLLLLLPPNEGCARSSKKTIPVFEEKRDVNIINQRKQNIIILEDGRRKEDKNIILINKNHQEKTFPVDHTGYNSTYQVPYTNLNSNVNQGNKNQVPFTNFNSNVNQGNKNQVPFTDIKSNNTQKNFNKNETIFNPVFNGDNNKNQVPFTDIKSNNTQKKFNKNETIFNPVFDGDNNKNQVPFTDIKLNNTKKKIVKNQTYGVGKN